MNSDDPIWDELFHGCAWEAFLQIGAETGQWPPDSEKTKQRAYKLFEDAKKVDSLKKPR